MSKKVKVFQAASWSKDNDDLHPGCVVLQGSRTFLVNVQSQEQANQLMALLAQLEVIEESEE